MHFDFWPRFKSSFVDRYRSDFDGFLLILCYIRDIHIIFPNIRITSTGIFMIFYGFRTVLKKIVNVGFDS